MAWNAERLQATLAIADAVPDPDYYALRPMKCMNGPFIHCNFDGD